MNRPVIQITCAQIERAATQMQRTWRKRHVTCSRSRAQELYVYDLVETINVILDHPVENGFLPDSLENLDQYVVDPKLLEKWLATGAHTKGACVWIRDTQIERAVNKTCRTYKKWMVNLYGFRFTRRQIKHLLLSSLVQFIERALTVPDRDGTVQDLIEADLSAADSKRVAKYLVA